jgi:hypothetical protein
MRWKYVSLIIGGAILLSMLIFWVLGNKNESPTEDNKLTFVQASLYQIIVPTGETPVGEVPTGEEVSASPVSTTATLLQEKLRLITGVTLPIYEDGNKTGEAKLIKVGFNAVIGKGAEGFQVKTDGDNIELNGNSGRAVLYAMFHYLEESYNYRQYTTDLEVYDKVENKLMLGINYTYEPPFATRNLRMTNVSHTRMEETETYDEDKENDNEFRTANGENFTANTKWGGGSVFAGTFGHTMLGGIISGEYFTTNPEWFAYRNGERINNYSGQLCLTNEDMFAVALDRVKEIWENRNENAVLVDVSQEDNQNYCQCDKCNEKKSIYGGESAVYIWFLNKLSNELAKDPEMSGIKLMTLAFQGTDTPPTKIVANDNVIVRICPMNSCYAHSFDDENCSANKEFAQKVDGWKSVAKHLAVWSYGSNFTYPLVSLPNINILQKNMQYFAQNGFESVYENGRGDLYGTPEFEDLRMYLTMRLQFNPYVDFEKEMNGFLNAYYGSGYENIKNYIDLICDNAGAVPSPDKDAHQGGNYIYKNPQSPDYIVLTPKEIEDADGLWANAIALADDETKADRVKRSQLSWRFWKLVMVGDFQSSAIATQREALWNDFSTYGITRFSNGVEFITAPDFSRTVMSWAKNYSVDNDPDVISFSVPNQIGETQIIGNTLIVYVPSGTTPDITQQNIEISPNAKVERVNSRYGYGFIVRNKTEGTYKRYYDVVYKEM